MGDFFISFFMKQPDTLTISSEGGWSLQVISGRAPWQGQCMASWITPPASHLSLAVMCKEHEKDQPAPGPFKYADKINKIHEIIIL